MDKRQNPTDSDHTAAMRKGYTKQDRQRMILAHWDEYSDDEKRAAGLDPKEGR